MTKKMEPNLSRARQNVNRMDSFRLWYTTTCVARVVPKSAIYYTPSVPESRLSITAGESSYVSCEERRVDPAPVIEDWLKSMPLQYTTTS